MLIVLVLWVNNVAAQYLYCSYRITHLILT